MTLEGANAFCENNLFTIYTVNSMTSGEYAVVIPKNITGTVNMLIDFHRKEFFDQLISGNKTKEDLIKEVEVEYNFIKNTYPNFMLVFPMFVENDYISTINSNDKQKMFDEVKKVGAITSELYKNITHGGFLAQNINQKIIILSKTNEDIKFIDWLRIQMPNFVEGLKYVEETKEEANPFMGMNPFGSASTEQSTSAPVSSGSIFDTPLTPPVTPVPPVAPSVVESTPTNDIFGTPTQSQSSVAPTPKETSIPNTNSIFGTPNQNLNESTSAINQSATSDKENSSTTSIENSTVTNSQAPIPTPVNTVDLEGTTAFRPIPGDTTQVKNDNEAVKVENAPKSIEEVQEEHKTSKGIANLLILLVILVGVTIASIELGKFLYNVYGK